MHLSTWLVTLMKRFWSWTIAACLLGTAPSSHSFFAAPILSQTVIGQNRLDRINPIGLMRGTKLGTLIRQDAANELQLSSAQRAAVRNEFSKSMPSGKQSSPPAFVSDGMIRDMLRSKFQEVEAKVLPNLSPKQLDRLNQLVSQLEGVEFLYKKSTKSKLKLSRDQEKAFSSSEKSWKSAVKGMRQDEARLNSLQTDYRFVLVSSLTQIQKKVLDGILGQEFKFDSAPSFIVDLPGGR
jgi:hypothetical protein